jgi:hypothetical protein
MSNTPNYHFFDFFVLFPFWGFFALRFVRPSIYNQEDGHEKDIFKRKS